MYVDEEELLSWSPLLPDDTNTHTQGVVVVDGTEQAATNIGLQKSHLCFYFTIKGATDLDNLENKCTGIGMVMGKGIRSEWQRDNLPIISSIGGRFTVSGQFSGRCGLHECK